MAPSDKRPPAIADKNQFITETAKVAMHALIIINPATNTRDPKGIAQTARKYAVELWRAMRIEAL